MRNKLNDLLTEEATKDGDRENEAIGAVEEEGKEGGLDLSKNFLVVLVQGCEGLLLDEGLKDSLQRLEVSFSGWATVMLGSREREVKDKIKEMRR